MTDEPNKKGIQGNKDSVEEHKALLLSLSQNYLHTQADTSCEIRGGRRDNNRIKSGNKADKTSVAYLHVSLDHKKGWPRGSETLCSVGTVLHLHSDRGHLD